MEIKIMERTKNFGVPCKTIKRTTRIRKVKKRYFDERLVVQFGLGLNAVVIAIIIYAEFFLL